MAGIGVITNPHSRRNRRNPEQIERLAFIVGDDDAFELTRAVTDVRSAARRFRDQRIDILALNGGDGTNHITLTEFIEEYGDTPLPRVAILRGGTQNTIANAFGVRGTPGSILLNLSEKYYLGEEFEVTRRHILRVEDGQEARYGFIFGNGIFANFLREYYELTDPNPVTAGLLLAKVAGSAIVRGTLFSRVVEPFKAKVLADGEPWIEGEFSAVMASTQEQVPLGFRLFHRAYETSHGFHAIAAKREFAAAVTRLPAIRVGRPLDPSLFHETVTSRLEFETDGGMGYTIDGDLYETSEPVSIGLGPELEFIVK